MAELVPPGNCIEAGDGRPQEAPSPQAALPAPEGDDEGYLTEEWLDSLRAWDATFYDAPRFWLETFPAAVACMSCARCDVSIVDDDIRGRSHLIVFVTGGWSGAEELIDVILSKTWLARYHTLWRSGGYYEITVPESEVAFSATRQPASRAAAQVVGEGSREEHNPDPAQ